ncbi:DUF3857 domain-containing protein [Fulvivirga sp. M361]|uniref:DUF3857 domain-containing protein n=1 Tax=Fulvivirga sp. M361 TaxID=2594266 RepID=UPI001627906B|nr:DUF3857 domain-containing protein [Fulvivirga sp. M361]
MSDVVIGQVLDYSTKVKIEGEKRITEKSLLIQINRKEENWLSNVTIYYSADQKFDLVEAYIIDSNGKTVRQLKKKEITTRSDISSGSFYEDDFIKEFTLQWNTYPYRIKYTYHVTEKDFVYVTRWYPTFFTGVATLKSSLTVELPATYKTSMDYTDDLEYNIQKKDKNQILRWEKKTSKTVKSEVFSPPLLELLSHVHIVPVEFNYGVPGNSESWASYGKWHYALNSGADLLSLSEKMKVNDLIAGVTDKKEIVRILYHYLQDNTTYINVAIDVGGLKPYPASYVCQNKYGDCKALTIYMKALLKHAGISSFYTVINSGSNIKRVNKNLPGQQFNHVILSVPIDGDTLWLENTSNSSPYDYLGTFTQGRYALLVDKDHSRLITTPKLELNDVLEKRTYTFALNEAGSGTVNIDKNLKGGAFESYCYYKRELNEKEQKRKIMQDLDVKKCEIEEWEIKHTDRDRKDLNVLLKARCFDQFRKVGKMNVIQPVPMKIPSFEKPSARKNPVRISFPINRSDSIIYELSGLERYTTELPDNSYIATEYGKYEERYVQNETGVIVVRRFQLYAADYSRASYNDFFSFIKSINTIRKQSAIILTYNK